VFHDGDIVDEDQPVPEGPSLMTLKDSFADVFEQRERCWEKINKEDIAIPFSFEVSKSALGRMTCDNLLYFEIS